MMNKNFRIDIIGDLEFEDLIADIYFKDECIAMLSQEQGFKNMKIHIYPKLKGEDWEFLLNEFEEIIQIAKKRLWELRKI